MKGKLLILAGLFMFFQLGFSLSCFFPYYQITEKEVIYIGLQEKRTVEKADIESFKMLDGAFAVDKDYVYYLGKPLENIDRTTFEITDWFIPVPNDPVWGIGCQTQSIIEFKDKNGTYKLEDLRNKKLK